MSVFDVLYADHYDRLYAEKNYVSECDMIEEAIGRYGNIACSSVLDMGCGTGGHTIELCARGYGVTGVDLSGAMLAHARQKSTVLPVTRRPVFLCSDLRNLKLGERFDLALMMFAVLGYLTSNEEVLQGLRNIRGHLNKGALLIFDYWYGPSVLSVRPGDRVRELLTPEGRVVRSASTTLDTYRHTADVTFKLQSFAADECTDETIETHTMRYFFPQEIALFLNQAGFSLRRLSAFPSLDKALTDQTWNALAVAEAC